MKLRNPLTMSVVVILVAILALAACDDSNQPVGPAIPTLSATEASTGNSSGVQTVANGPLNAECACAEWSCAISDCGYDPPTHPYGACCLACEPNPSNPPAPKPSCEPEGGGGTTRCSDLLGAMQFGEEFLDNPNGFCRSDLEADTSHASFDPRCVSPAVSGDPNGGDFWFGTVCPIEFTCCYGGNYGDPIIY